MNKLIKNSETFPLWPLNGQKMMLPGGQRLRMLLPFCPQLVKLIGVLLCASPVRGDSNAQSPSVQSLHYPSNYATPPASGAAAEWPFSEREMAQLAIQELIQLQKERRRKGGGTGEGAEQRHADTKIWPYSLYERQMNEIFGERKKGTNKQKKEQSLKTNTPVIIHLPAFRSTAKARGGGATDAFSGRKSSKWSPFDRAEVAPKLNPIRPQSNRWNAPSDGEEEFGNSKYGTRSETEWKGRNDRRLSKANNRLVPTRSKSSSAENSLITRPENMFMPYRNVHRLRPIEPINSTPDQKQQLFIKSITSDADAAGDGGKRLSPSANSAFISGTALAPSSALSLPSVSPLSPNSVAPLVGSPFDLMGQAVPNAAAVQPNALLSQLPNPLQFLSQGSTLEQITSLARNLIQMSNGKTDLLSSLSKAIGSPASAADSATSKLTSTAVHSIAKSASKVAAQGEKTTVVGGTNGGGEATKTLFSSNGTTETEEKQQTNGTSSVDLLSALPSEQRILLEAAMKNGELDMAQTENALSGETNGSKRANAPENGGGKSGGTAKVTKLVNAESRLMEWIQQNRPRPVASDNEQKRSGKSKENADKSAGEMVGAEKLPYYGKYCGHFVEQTNLSRPHSVAGAVWAVDERRLLISKFHFQPFEHSENITFWAGPAKHTGASQDFFPSENGFFLSPAKLDPNTFAHWPLQKFPARTRAPILPINGRDYYGVNSTLEKGQTAEEEEEEETGRERGRKSEERGRKKEEETKRKREEETERKDGTRGTREKRNLYSELYEQMASDGTATPANLAAAATTASSTETTAGGKRGNDAADGTVAVPVHLEGMPQNFHLSLGGGETTKRGHQQKGEERLDAINKFGTNKENSNGLAIDTPAETERLGEECHWTSLGWHGGTQPILITLPDSRLIKMLNWLSVWDHVQKQAIALVLLPSSASGAAFQPLSSVQLRPLPVPNASLGKRLQSGPIRILDTKTIELTEFSLSTEGLPVWFMVGKEIVPNRNGQIVPIFNRNTRTFDCDSLRDFHNETVTLRLPDPLGMEDVFWFSVYSIPRSQSLSHIYIPYNDMQLPPALLALPTPQCVWNPPSPG